MIPFFIYIDFATSDKPQEWFIEQPPPFPLISKIGDIFMFKHITGAYAFPWAVKYFIFDGTEWREI